MKRFLLTSFLIGLIPSAYAADTCNFVSEYYPDVTIEVINGEYNNDYIWLYSINEEGKVSSITEYLSDLLFVKQLYGQEICGEKKMMEQL